MAAKKKPEADELQKISTALTEFNVVDAGIAKLRETYGTVVYDVSTRRGMEVAKAARAAIREPRYQVERIRKEAKAPLLDLGRRLDREAKRITDALLAIEEPIDRVIVAEEERLEREGQEAIAREQARVAKLQERVTNIRGTPRLVRATTDAATIGRLLAEMTAFTVDDTFAEMREAAEAARAEALRELADLHRRAQEREAREEAVRREAERLKREREEQEARERAAREQREAEERAHRERMAEIEARERAIAERERQQREREEAEARARAEADRNAAVQPVVETVAEAIVAPFAALAEVMAPATPDPDRGRTFVTDPETPSDSALCSVIARFYRVPEATADAWLRQYGREKAAA